MELAMYKNLSKFIPLIKAVNESDQRKVLNIVKTFYAKEDLSEIETFCLKKILEKH